MDHEITCNECEQPLGAEIDGNKIIVAPCKTCVDKSYEDGHSDGHRSGYDEGYGEGHKDGFC